jgi:hypothetical protein
MINEELLNQSCDDPAVWQKVILMHEITKEEFDTRVSNYFGPVQPTMLRMPGQDLCALHENCRTMSWQYDPRATMNEQIDLKLDELRADNQYSLALFRGLAYWKKAVSYEFTLGQDEKGKKSVVFVTYNELDVAVYHGNISSLMP